MYLNVPSWELWLLSVFFQRCRKSNGTRSSSCHIFSYYFVPYFRSEDEIPVSFDPEDDRWVEIWNNVFMQFNKDKDGNITELPKKNVDTGMGVERTTAILEGVNDNYQSSIWKDVIELISNISGVKYEDNMKSMRIIADHLRTAVFISADPAGIKPSNTDQGYILRRLIRRAIRHAKTLNIDINSDWEQEIAKLLLEKYKVYYKELVDNYDVVLEVLRSEKVKFNRTLEKGLREFEKVTNHTTPYYLGLVNENEEIVAATLLLEEHLPMNNCSLYAPRGFVIEYKNHRLLTIFTEKLKDFAKHKKAILTNVVIQT